METVKEDCATSYCFTEGLLRPNEVSRVAQQVKKGEGRKPGKDGIVGVVFYLVPIGILGIVLFL